MSMRGALRTGQGRPLMDAQWCRAMATLLSSGLTPEQTLASIKQQAAPNDALIDACGRALVLIGQGASLVSALTPYHFFNRYQLAQLRIGEGAGKMISILLSIANRMQKQDERNKKLRAQLKLSQAVIVIGLVAGTFLTMARGGRFLPEIFGLLMIIIFTKLIYMLLDVDVFYLLAKGWDRGVIRVSTTFKRYFEYYWYGLLSAQLEAGVDPVHALMNMHDLFPSPDIKARCMACLRDLEQGRSLTDALSNAHLILTDALRQVLLIAEQSGRVAPSLLYHLAQEGKQLEVTVATFYEWLPRLYYVVALSVVLRFMF